LRGKNRGQTAINLVIGVGIRLLINRKKIGVRLQLIVWLCAGQYLDHEENRGQTAINLVVLKK
jgi:hypothetical protein